MSSNPFEEMRSNLLLPIFEDENSIGRLMFKKISSASIGFAGAANAFDDIMSSVRDAQYIRPCDLLELHNTAKMGKNVFARDGYAILLVEGSVPPKYTAWFENSVVTGIYRLISRTNGIAIELTSDEYESIEGARFFFCPHKRARGNEQLMRSWGMYARTVGYVGGNRVRVSVDSEVRMDALKQELLDDSDNGIVITPEHTEYYWRSFKETLVYSSLDAACSAKRLDIGFGGDLSSLVASLLGVYSAAKTYGLGRLKQSFHIGYTVAVRTDIRICDRMIVSLFDPTDIRCGRMTNESLLNMNSVLRGLFCCGDIAGAVPVRGTLDETLASILQGDAVLLKEQQMQSEIPAGALIAFGMRAVGGRRLGTIQMTQPSEVLTQ